MGRCSHAAATERAYKGSCFYRFQREAEAARRDAAAFAEDKQRMEQELAYMRVITNTSAAM